jgi:hypothetical protein
MANYLQYRPATIDKLSAIPPTNNWQAICNTAQQHLASYLQYRPATIGNQAATPEIQLASVPDPSHLFLVRILESIPDNNGSGCGSAPKIFSFRINEI